MKCGHFEILIKIQILQLFVYIRIASGCENGSHNFESTSVYFPLFSTLLGIVHENLTYHSDREYLLHTNVIF